MQREHGNVGLRTRAAAFIVGSYRMGRVAKHQDASQLLLHVRRCCKQSLYLWFLNECHNALIVAWETSNVDRNDGLCAWRDSTTNGLNAYVEVFTRVDHHRFATRPKHSHCCGAIGIGRHDNLIARL